jgi:pimeloyl-ACP methyl ester carboxylesterase
MRGFVRILIAGLKLLILTLFGALAVTLRYLWSTPQPLRSDIPGDPRIYKWTHGTIFYKVAGPADAPPLVLLHAPAIGASSYEMRHLITGLAQHYRVYAPDLPGFGLSDRPHLHYTAETYVQLCQDFVANVIAQPAILLGSGLSCNYSVAVAARQPDLCRGIILLSPRTFFKSPRPQLPRWLVQLLLHPLTALPFYSLFTTRAILRMILSWPYTINSPINSTTSDTQVSPEEFASIFANAHQFGAEHAALAWVAGKLDLDVHPQLEQLTQPVLTIWGRQALMSPSSIPATTGQNSSLSAAKMVIIEGSGQRVHETLPAQVVASILTWLKTWLKVQEPITVTATAEQNTLAENRANTETASLAVRPEDKALTETLPVENGEQSLELTDETLEKRETVVVETMVDSMVDSRDRIDLLPDHQPEAYCVRCRQKRTMHDPRKIVTKNGRSALEGTCPVCGTRLFRFTKS